MQRLGELGLALVVLGLLPATLARGAEGDTPTVVLGLEALEGAPDSVAAEATDALRQRVASAKGFQLLQGKDLVEVKLVFACPDEAPACMAQAGKSLGAEKLIFGNVKLASPDVYQITLKLLDVDKAAVESFTGDSVPKDKADATGLRALAPGWMAKLTGKGSGVIQVRSNVHGAAVSLDGTRVGTTGTTAVVINDVAPGPHEVAIEKRGYTTTKQDFTLGAGQSLPLNLTASPLSVEVPRPGPSSPLVSENAEPGGTDRGRTLTHVGFWVAVAGTVASAAIAGGFGYNINQINKQLDPYRRIPCSSAASGYCDGNGKPVDSSMVPLTTGQLQTVNDKTSQGNKDQVLQWVFVGLSGAFAVGAGVLFYKGYLAPEGTKSASNHGLRIFPTASASSGGIIAEFDF